MTGRLELKDIRELALEGRNPPDWLQLESVCASYVRRLIMRVIAGKFRSRRLRSIPGLEIRPTSDRLRETLFNVLTAGNPQALEGSVWLDLFAGTGAVGIEALSRGAAKVCFVEKAKRAVDLIRKNLESLGVEGANYELVSQDALHAIRAMAQRGTQPEYIFLDPPYAMREAYDDTLHELADLSHFERALVIVEHEKKFDPGETIGKLHRGRKLEQGDAALSFYRRRDQSGT